MVSSDARVYSKAVYEWFAESAHMKSTSSAYKFIINNTYISRHWNHEDGVLILESKSKIYFNHLK